jgi:uncharacterized protein (DUF427 family)
VGRAVSVHDDPAKARARALWRHVGDERPTFAVTPGPGQQSVWDFPRPPALVPDAREVLVRTAGIEIARSTRTLRLLETASPPTFYIPAADVRIDLLQPAEGSSHCEWKGEARYRTFAAPDGRRGRAWTYPDPQPPYQALAGHFAFYPGDFECFVDGARVQPQPGRFYAGWITPELVGPFKGEPGSQGW